MKFARITLRGYFSDLSTPGRLARCEKNLLSSPLSTPVFLTTRKSLFFQEGVCSVERKRSFVNFLAEARKCFLFTHGEKQRFLKAMLETSYCFCRRARCMRRFASRLAISARLSYAFFPCARAMETLISPLLTKSARGMTVIPSFFIFP